MHSPTAELQPLVTTCSSKKPDTRMHLGLFDGAVSAAETIETAPPRMMAARISRRLENNSVRTIVCLLQIKKVHGHAIRIDR